jgi:hypothetical protein
VAALKALPAEAGCKIRVEGRCKGADMTYNLKFKTRPDRPPSGLIQLEPSNGGHYERKE